MKIVVAYSGGLDTSYTVMYLANQGHEVHAVSADTGGFSPEQLQKNEENAYKLGAKKFVNLDVKDEYYEKSLKYMVYGNVLRGGTYPISVSSERIFQAIAIARYAKMVGADAIAHGSTGAGNDQVRFDMTFQVMCPDMKIITLTRDKALTRQEEVDYLNAHGFPADFAKLKYSYNVGLWGTSICGGELLDSAQGLPESAYLKPVTKSGEKTVKLGFEKGQLVAVDGKTFDSPVAAIQALEASVEGYGLGRDIHVGYWKDQVGTWYGMFLHESQYLEPVMRDIEAMLESSQRYVTGTVIVNYGPKQFETVGVESVNDLVKTKFGEYGEMQKGWTAEDAKGFIKVLSTPLRVYYNRHEDEL